MINRNKTAIWFVVLALIAIVIYFLFGHYTLVKKWKDYSEIKDTQNQLSLQQFLEIIRGRESVGIQIYYFPFSSESTELLTEAHVIETSFLKMNLEYLATGYHAYGDYFTNALEDVSDLKITRSGHDDFRYCCLIKTRSDKYIRFSISRLSRDILFINGQPYKATFQTLQSFLQLIPARHYEQAIKELDIANTEQSLK